MLLDHDFIESLNHMGSQGEPFLFIIDFEGLSPMVFSLGGLSHGIRFTMPGYPEAGKPSAQSDHSPLKRFPVPFELYRKAFKRVMFHLQQGNSYLVNLTFPTRVETALSLDEIYDRSGAPYKLLVPDRFVVFSPEPFIRIRKGVISSFPMKGTIDAAIPDAESMVLNDPKEKAEHNTIVDLIRNDLSKVADQVEVRQYRYIDRIRTEDREILQVSSEIAGILPADYPRRIGDILDSLLPAGSVSGAPKGRTLEIIREAESGPRGFYTGIFGVFDGLNLDSAVMIRFIGKTDAGLFYRSGGGITHMSKAESEYQELLDKVYLHKKRDA